MLLRLLLITCTAPFLHRISPYLMLRKQSLRFFLVLMFLMLFNERAVHNFCSRILAGPDFYAQVTSLLSINHSWSALRRHL